MTEIEEIKRRLDRLERATWPSQYPQQPFMPIGVLPSYKCDVCHIEFKGVMGYYCPRSDCPKQPKVT